MISKAKAKQKKRKESEKEMRHILGRQDKFYSCNQNQNQRLALRLLSLCIYIHEGCGVKVQVFGSIFISNGETPIAASHAW